MAIPIKMALSKLTIPSAGKLLGKAGPAAKGPPGSATPPAASPGGLTTRASQGAPAPRGAKPEWAVLGQSHDPVKRDATIMAAHMKSRENVKNHGPRPFQDGVGKGGVDEWEMDSPGASPASPGASPWSARTAVGDPPGSPGSPGSALSGTTLPGDTTSSPTTARAGGQSPAADDASPIVLNNLGSSKSSGSKPSGGGSKAAALASSVAGQVLPKGSGAGAVAQALDPTSGSPAANAVGNLIGTALPSLSGGLQRLDSKAQTNKMAGIGDDIPDKTKIASGDLTHGANADAIAQTQMAADNTLFGIAQNNTINAINSAKQNAGLVAATVKGNAEVAKNGAQTLGG